MRFIPFQYNHIMEHADKEVLGATPVPAHALTLVFHDTALLEGKAHECTWHQLLNIQLCRPCQNMSSVCNTTLQYCSGGGCAFSVAQYCSCADSFFAMLQVFGDCQHAFCVLC